jgi:hypothetical protein
MNLSPTAQARFLVTQTKKAGATLPKPVAAAFERVSRSNEALSQHRPERNPQALGEAVATALAAGADPAADPEVQRLITARALAEIDVTAQLEVALAEEFRSTCREHADAIVKALRKPFTIAAGNVEAAAALIGEHPLKDSAGILAHGGDAARAWASAKESVATIDAAAAVWAILLSFTHLGQANPHMRALRIADLDYQTWTRLGLGAEGSAQDAWTLARAGVPLSLPTFAEYQQRVQVIAAGTTKARADAEARSTALLMGHSA